MPHDNIIPMAAARPPERNDSPAAPANSVAPIPLAHLRSIFDPRPNLYDSRIDEPEPRAPLDRLIGFFNTPFGFGFYIGVCVGSVGTVGAAFVWGLFL